MADRATRDGGRGWLFVALAVVGVAYFGTMADVTSELGAASIPIWGATLVGMILLANSAIGKAIGRKIAGPDPDAHQQLDVPDEVYAELDELRARLLEMEERQDFAERMLAARPAADRLDHGGGS